MVLQPWYLLLCHKSSDGPSCGVLLRDSVSGHGSFHICDEDWCIVVDRFEMQALVKC